MNVNEAMNMTKTFEGYSRNLYRCPAGYWTIGYGRNIEKVGVSRAEAEFLFQNDYNNAIKDLMILLEENHIDIKSIPQDVLFVLTDMMFNMGYNTLSKFKKLLYELKNGSYEGVIREMKDSKWYTQVGDRSKKLVEIIKNVTAR